LNCFGKKWVSINPCGGFDSRPILQRKEDCALAKISEYIKLSGVLLGIISILTVICCYNILIVREDTEILFEHLNQIEMELESLNSNLKNLSGEIENLNQSLKELNEFLGKAEIRKMEATAYTHTGNQTFTGTWPKIGTVAVDPRKVPLGTRGYVIGYGFVIAEDTGGLIKGDIIDLFMETEEECWEWGRRPVEVIWFP
jgi:3D (Asp-Asp-Asp) domain-containing protein